MYGVCAAWPGWVIRWGGGVCVSCTRLVFTHFLPCVMTECVRQVCLAKYT